MLREVTFQGKTHRSESGFFLNNHALISLDKAREYVERERLGASMGGGEGSGGGVGGWNEAIVAGTPCTAVYEEMPIFQMLRLPYVHPRDRNA